MKWARSESVCGIWDPGARNESEVRNAFSRSSPQMLGAHLRWLVRADASRSRFAERSIKAFIVARLLRGKRPEDLERGELKAIISTVVLPGLAEADEAEAFAWGTADREVAGQEVAVQVLVVLAAINDLPRVVTSFV